MPTIACPTEPKVDPRVRRTRKLIEDAFRSLLSERRYVEISVGEIAERATVNRATFYAHFEDKRHLATAMLRDDLHAALLARLTPGSALDRACATEIGAALFEFVDRLFQTCPKVADELGPSIATILQESIEGFIQTWIGHNPDARKLFPDSSPESLATALAWSLYGGALRWTRLTRRPPATKAAGEIVALIVR